MEKVQESESLNRWIRTEAQKIAEVIGLSEIPLKDPTFDFYGYTYKVMQGYGLRGQNLYEGIYDVLREVMINLRTGGPGRVYRFPEWYERHPDRGFDEYFKMNVHQMAIKDARWRGRQKRRQRVPILPAGEEDFSGGISEESLGAEALTPDQIAEKREFHARWDEIQRDLPELLLRQRRGPLLLKIWESIQQGKIPAHITRELNALAESHPEYRTPREVKWTDGTVSRQIHKIYDIIRDYYNTGIESSARTSERISFRTRVYQSGTDFGRVSQ